MTVSTPARRGVATESMGSPAATRTRSSGWRDPRLVVGIALVAVCGLLGALLLGGGGSGTTVWVARDALGEGQTVSAADLVAREIRFVDQAEADRYLPADEPLPAGSLLARPVGAGELLPRAALSAAEPDPVLEVPLAVPVDSVPVTVRAGSVVDVWVTPDPAGAERGTLESELVLSQVRVLELGRVGGSLGAGGTRQVVVGVGPGQEANLPTALARVAAGSVVLVRTP
ncbi:hypothetical protein [Nocardioides mesophilus]|uniref:SAF domain-containing protein n=1 Tax=Nocardioides mesophilus TaxID=433659 RepID=A0A7G9RDC9_9ACTN|nr:hypothetical protein [Nocardioides mesophilus]QNN53604.1 hypothetical protein H9L09_04035 [Nocardioides mesophilus]